MVSKRAAIFASLLLGVASVHAMQEEKTEKTTAQQSSSSSSSSSTATTTTPATTTMSTALVHRRSVARQAQQEQKALTPTELRVLFRGQNGHPALDNALFADSLTRGQQLNQSVLRNALIQHTAPQARQIHTLMQPQVTQPVQQQPAQEQSVTSTSLFNAFGRYLYNRAADVAALPGRAAQAVVQSRPVQATIHAGRATVNGLRAAVTTTANGVAAVTDAVIHPLTTTQRIAGAIAQRIVQTRVVGQTVNAGVATTHAVSSAVDRTRQAVTHTAQTIASPFVRAYNWTAGLVRRAPEQQDQAPHNQDQQQQQQSVAQLPGAAAEEISPAQAFFAHEDNFFMMVDQYALKSENLINGEVLRESIKEILALSSINTECRAWLDYRLQQYTSGNGDQASFAIKVMRYILSKHRPEYKESFNLMTSLQQIEPIIAILALTDEQIFAGNLMDQQTILGEYFRRCTQTEGSNGAFSSYKAEAVFSSLIRRVEIAYQNDRPGLQQALIVQNVVGSTPLHYALYRNFSSFIKVLQRAFSNNSEALQPILAAHDHDIFNSALTGCDYFFAAELLPLYEEAFAHNIQELKRILTYKQIHPYPQSTIYAFLCIRYSSEPCPQLAINYLKALQRVFVDNDQGLRQILRQNDCNYGYLQVYQNINFPGVMNAYKDIYLQAFANNLQELQVLLSPSFDQHKHDIIKQAFLAGNPEIMEIVMQWVQQAFANNSQGFQEFFTKKYRTQDTYLNDSIRHYCRDEAIMVFIRYMEQAFAGNSEGLRAALTFEDRNGNSSLSLARRFTGAHSEVTRKIEELIHRSEHQRS